MNGWPKTSRMYSPYMRNRSLGPPGPVGKTTRIGLAGQPSICSAKLGSPMSAMPAPALADRNPRRVSISDPPVSAIVYVFRNDPMPGHSVGLEFSNPREQATTCDAPGNARPVATVIRLRPARGRPRETDMSAEQSKPKGPDLTQGVPFSDIPDGGMIAGHVGDEAVLLALRGEEFFAIGATCSHYGGPLAEGLVVGDTVRCAWNHACFSLRTGEALRAPALKPVACWEVETRD